MASKTRAAPIFMTSLHRRKRLTCPAGGVPNEPERQPGAELVSGRIRAAAQAAASDLLTGGLIASHRGGVGCRGLSWREGRPAG